MKKFYFYLSDIDKINKIYFIFRKSIIAQINFA